MRRVVITGMGAVTPIGINISNYKDGLYSGINGISNITHFDTSKFQVKERNCDFLVILDLLVFY